MEKIYRPSWLNFLGGNCRNAVPSLPAMRWKNVAASLDNETVVVCGGINILGWIFIHYFHKIKINFFLQIILFFRHIFTVP